ncbi:hypothetical protein GSF70_09895 [Flavobacteriaceae bacterium W22]|nr:hypothetical protein [Flavobacteriaceae bacterium W22]
MGTTSILSNPYNQVGQMHNDGMQFVSGNINPSSTIDQIVQSCALYVQKLSDNSSSETYVNWNAFISESINRTEKLLLSGMIDWLLQKDLITKEGMDFINSINDLSDDLSLSEVVSKIDSIENDILSSKMSVENNRILFFMQLLQNTVPNMVNYRKRVLTQNGKRSKLQESLDGLGKKMLKEL